MLKNYDFDYIIIGSGPAGRTVVKKLAKAGKNTAVLEAQGLGGAELTTRDFPYRYYLDFAHNYRTLMNSPAMSGSIHFNFPTLSSTLETKIKSAQNTFLQEFKDLNITFIPGFAHFLDPHTIAVGSQKYTSKNFILATGSILKSAEISGLETVKHLTPNTAFSIRRLPKFVFIVGGGPTGVEIAEFYASLGTGVIIMDRGAHLLPREDEDVAAFVTDYFANSLGITVMTSAKVTAITEDRTSKIVVFNNGTGEKMVRVDTIVLATGSEPFLDYGLENAGVDYKRTNIIVDKYFNTTAKHIYAIGDATGCDDSSTSKAILEAETLAENLLHRQKSIAKYSGLARCINLQTAIVTTGLNERDATSRDLKYQKSVKSIPSDSIQCTLNTKNTHNNQDIKSGFIKTLTDHSGRTLGTTIVAPHADLAFSLKKLLTK